MKKALQAKENNITRGSVKPNQMVKSYPSRTIVHAKLEMTEPGDADEQEADAAANDVMSGKVCRQISGGGASGGISVSSQMESSLNALAGRGRAMPEGLKDMMERGFGRDFSQVRLHTDASAVEMSSSIHAKAFTHGNDIYFNRGQFNPESHEGQKLVAHELTHVAQGGRKVSRDERDEVCRNISVSDFSSCKNQRDDTACVADINKKFNDEYENCKRIEGESQRKVYWWYQEQTRILSDNKGSYCNAIHTFFDKMKDYDESIIYFKVDEVSNIITTAMGVAEVFMGEKTQVIIELAKPAVPYIAQIIAPLDKPLIAEPNIDYAKDRFDLIHIFEFHEQLQRARISQLINILLVKASYYNMTEKQFDSLFENIKKHFSIRRVGSNGFLDSIIEKFISNALSDIENDDNDNEDSYYDKNKGKLESSTLFSVTHKNHKLINKYIDTFYSKNTLPESIIRDLEKYNNNVRKKFFERAKKDAISGEVIYYDRYKKRYEDDYHYYIDNLNKIIEVDGPNDDDQHFNKDIRGNVMSKLLESAKKFLDIYYDKEYKKFRITSKSKYTLVDTMNGIIRSDGCDGSEGSFNDILRPFLREKILHDIFRISIREDELTSGFVFIPDYYIYTYNEILKIDGMTSEDEKIFIIIKELMSYHHRHHPFSPYPSYPSMESYILHVVMKLSLFVSQKS